MPAILQQEWLNQNAGRAYPFQENTTRYPHDVNGRKLTSLALPNYVIVDMIFTMPGPSNIRMYLAQFARAGNLLTFVFRETGTNAIVTTVTFDANTHVPGTGYSLAGTSDWFDARGWLTIGDLRKLAADIPEGLYDYEPDQTLLETRVVRPALRGIRSLRVVNRDNTSDYLYGHVKLLAGDNVRLQYDRALNGVWVHAEPNAGYRETCDCESPTQTNLVNTINGIPAENLTVVGDGECVEVRTEGDKIIISDKCSEPCCGCPELEFLTTSAKVLEASLSQLESYAEQLSERISTFVTNFVLTVSR
jgi:hypothetical protein